MSLRSPWPEKTSSTSGSPGSCGVFTSLLAEAGHTREPGAILDAAWQYEDRLEKVFGPFFK